MTELMSVRTRSGMSSTKTLCKERTVSNSKDRSKIAKSIFISAQ